MLPIISAEERLKERHSAKIALVGPAGVDRPGAEKRRDALRQPVVLILAEIPVIDRRGRIAAGDDRLDVPARGVRATRALGGTVVFDLELGIGAHPGRRAGADGTRSGTGSRGNRPAWAARPSVICNPPDAPA